MASLLLGKKKKKKIVVFLCTGNTCRGPMAQGYMKAAMEERGITGIEVRTAGVMTIPGLIPTPEATLVLKNAGIDIRAHRSSPLTPELIAKSDIILGMTPFHVQFALRMSDDARGKTFLLKEYAESDVKMFQISDPMGMTLEVYKRVYREMKLAIDRILDNKEFFTGQAPEAPAKEPEAPKQEKKKPARRKTTTKATGKTATKTSKKKTTASSSS